MEHNSYDLVVIGAGPAGEKGAVQAAYFGKRVAIVEAEAIGGASCNTGTLPSKTLRETSLLLSGAYARELEGIDLSLRREATVRDFLSHEERVTQSEREVAEENLRRHNVTVYMGSGSFIDEHTLRVLSRDGSETLLEAGIFLIATGSSPARPAMYAFEHERIWDSDEVLQMVFMPRSMAIVGAGVIGSEYACTFAALGIGVNLIDQRPLLFPFLDDDLREVLESQMKSAGIEFVMGDGVAGCQAFDDRVELRLESGRVLASDVLLVAAGRQANTRSLNLERIGLALGKKGTIPVNDHFRTEVPHVYAAGDVVGHPALASVSMEQARLAMVDAFDLKYKKSVGPVLPSSILTIPEVSTAGKSELDLVAEAVPHVVGRAKYGDNARGRIIGDTDGLLKLLFRKDDMRLLGVGVVGENAADLVHVGVMGLLANATNEMFVEACFNYPTLGQLYKYATYDAMGKAAAGSRSQ
jgi:NAD(P) transhydrogenase